MVTAPSGCGVSGAKGGGIHPVEGNSPGVSGVGSRAGSSGSASYSVASEDAICEGGGTGGAVQYEAERQILLIRGTGGQQGKTQWAQEPEWQREHERPCPLGRKRGSPWDGTERPRAKSWWELT